MIDTRNKRASVLGFALAALVVLPAPDSTITQPDRAQVTFSYAGLSSVAPVVAPADRVTLEVTFHRTVTIDASLRTVVTLEVER